MSRFTDKYNSNRNTFGIDTTDLPYINLRTLYSRFGADKVYPVRAIYINHKSKFGDSPIIATDTNLVNLPSNMLDTCKEILGDTEAIDDIKNGNIGFVIYTYKSKQAEQVCYSIDFVDM